MTQTTPTTPIAIRSTFSGPFRVTRPDHAPGSYALVSYGALPEDAPESAGIRVRAAELRERAALALRQAADADACADLAERQEAELAERAAAKAADAKRSREAGRVRRADPFGFEPWASATQVELRDCAAAAGILGAVKGRTYADVRSDLAGRDPDADLLRIAREAA